MTRRIQRLTSAALSGLLAGGMAGALYLGTSTTDAPTGGWVGGTVGPRFGGTGDWRPATPADDVVRIGGAR